MSNKIIILCPIAEYLKGAPGSLLFGSNYFTEVASQNFNRNVEVKYLYYRPEYNSNLRSFFLKLKITFRILLKRHDILYGTISPDLLVFVALFKVIGFYRKPIYCWKYIGIKRNGVKKLFYRTFYKAFNGIFMITEKHVKEAIDSGMISRHRISFQKWGEDLRYVDSFQSNKKAEDKVTFISIGKAQRDFQTLCKAFEGIEGAILKIFTLRKWGHFNYEEYLSKVNAPNILIEYTDQNLSGTQREVLDNLFYELHQADCSIVSCKRVNFGVGFTQVLDSLACSLPVILTYNEDNPINVEAEGAGINVTCGDVEQLQEAIRFIIKEKEKRKLMGKIGRTIIEKDYNIKTTANNILSRMSI